MRHRHRHEGEDGGTVGGGSGRCGMLRVKLPNCKKVVSRNPASVAASVGGVLVPVDMSQYVGEESWSDNRRAPAGHGGSGFANMSGRSGRVRPRSRALVSCSRTSILAALTLSWLRVECSATGRSRVVTDRTPPWGNGNDIGPTAVAAGPEIRLHGSLGRWWWHSVVEEKQRMQNEEDSNLNHPGGIGPLSFFQR